MSVVTARELVYCRNALGFINFRCVACRLKDRVGAIVSGMSTLFFQAQ